MALTCLFVSETNAQKVKQSDTTLLQPIEINAVRANENTPVAKTNLSKKEIEKINIGYDLPIILNQTPSIQVNSDAGNGIGYTGMRIRGTDASRINITLNGIPYNDAESQGTFFVNLPDISASANSIQIQRGVGTSTNGAGAFGGSVNINTNDVDTNKYIKLDNSFGSFNSIKNSINVHSGLLKKHWMLTGRLSNISSNGYIDRSKTKLQSFFTSAAYVNANQSFRINIFSGKEKTQAAWFGINQTTLDTNRTYNPAGTEKTGEPYNNETDNYTQTHYQFFYNRKVNPNIKFNVALFLTAGSGYFEQYKAAQQLSTYGLPTYINGNDTTYETDLIRQLWLDNKYYGSIFSVQYDKSKTSLNFGGSITKYDGKHFGKIIDALVKAAIPENYKWYNLTASKNDISFYGKWNQKLNQHWQTYLDIQVRNVLYEINGFKGNPSLFLKNNYVFLNPKAGITYTSGNYKVYFSYAKATKEPNRDDFETGVNEAPKPETLHDFELGYEYKNLKNFFGINSYYMSYKNQLVLTGKVNDVYAYTRTNIPNSFRTGIEIQGSSILSKWLSVSANTTFSINKVKSFTEFIDDYDNGGQKTNFYATADISYSPSIIGAATITIKPSKNLEVSLLSKYVSKQYLDNTSNKNRVIKNYFTEDVKINYSTVFKNKTSMNLFLQVNNLFSKKYVANGYTFSYIYGGEFTTENYYFPMATFNLMGGISLTL